MSHHHDHEEGWPGSLVESTQDERQDQPRTESRGDNKGALKMAKFEIEIDPALLVRDGQEFEPVAFREPKAEEWFLYHRQIVCPANPSSYGPRLILRPRPWRPKEGEEVLIMVVYAGRVFAKQEPWYDNNKGRSYRDTGTCWPLSRRAEAEATVERVKQAIGGGR
jgi:hypothetical protein